MVEPSDRLLAVKKLVETFRTLNLQRYAEGLVAATRETDSIQSDLVLNYWLLQTQNLESHVLDPDATKQIQELLATVSERLNRPDAAPAVSIRDVFEESAPRYESLRRELDEKVFSWSWSQGEAYRLAPYEAEINNFESGQWLKKPPILPSEEHWRYGRDMASLVLLAENGTATRVILFQRTSDTIDELHFDVSQHNKAAKILRFRRFLLDARHVIAVESCTHNSVSRRAYFSSGDSLYRIETEQWDKDLGRHDHLLELEHDEQGLSAIYELYPDGVRELRYQRPHVEETLDSLIKLIKPELIYEIRTTLSTLSPRSAAFSLCLYTDSVEGKLLPPRLALGLEEERDRLADPWVAEEYELFGVDLVGENWGLMSRCERANRLVKKQDSFQSLLVVNNLLKKTSRRLQKERETLPIPVTDDFEVFLYDVDRGRI